MTSSLLDVRSACLTGLIGWAGCAAPAATVGRALYPDYPLPNDLLAFDPCSVKESPDVYLQDASFDLLRPLRENLQFLKDANPVFLCGLERVEVLGDDAYKKSAPPQYTRRSVGIYKPDQRVISLKASAGITLTHEVGHSVQNLGFFAPTVREFLAQSWTFDPKTGTRVHRCEGPDCFFGEGDASSPTEDWARAFERVLMLPVETGVAVNFSLSGPDETPLQKKVALMRSIANLPAPLPAKARFGAAREVKSEDAAAWIEASLSPDLPASLPSETIRRIYRTGKGSIKSWIWDNRRRPFLAGDAVVFPAFLKDQKKLGFFAYDLQQERFRPLVIGLENIPAEFQAAAASFTDLEIVTDPDGNLLLIGQRPGAPTLAAPVEFGLSPRRSKNLNKNRIKSKNVWRHGSL